MTNHHPAVRNSGDNNLKVPRAARLFFSLSLILMAVMALSGCGGGGVGTGAAFVPSSLATISVVPAASTIMVGSTEQLQPVAEDQNGKVMPGIAFTFASSSGAASVSQTGLVTGIAAGSSVIDIRAGETSTSLTITVTAPPPVLTQISVSPSTASIAAGQSQTYTAVGYDQFNNLMSGIVFTWASDGNGAIAMLNGNVATGIAVGSVHITASALGISSAPATLMVLPPPPVLTSVVVTPASPSIFTGGTQQLTAV